MVSSDDFTSGRQVAEIQGLYGSYSFPEKLLQKIWLRGEFDRGGMRATDGRSVALRHPGKWNLLGGPDFKGARLSLGGGAEITGDVEIHLHADGWAAHGHALDPAYNSVVLHVVLFPPDSAHVTRGAGGEAIPVVALLPLLDHDIEQFAAEEALATLANRPTSRIPEELAPLPETELRALLQRHAAQRWAQKAGFARVRVTRLGWREACHCTALEILGYRFNRAPMLRIASACPLEAWGRGEADPATLLDGEAGAWSLQGVRPGNRPRLRLSQYAAWCRAEPDWPARLVEIAPELPVVLPEFSTGIVRRKHSLSALRRRLASGLGALGIPGTRFDTLVCDGFLPLLAAQAFPQVEGLWHHWYAGDLPPAVTRALSALGVVDGRAHPFTHGLGQGLFGWLLEQEGHAAPAP
ncbi:MAG: hypothetical protein JWM88_1130 [Verrucomicrobia bacterium]|nr:hypothetical protein [Verrucomicrobiota bacterium]